MTATGPLLEMEGISKAFPGVRALEEALLIPSIWRRGAVAAMAQ